MTTIGKQAARIVRRAKERGAVVRHAEVVAMLECYDSIDFHATRISMIRNPAFSTSDRHDTLVREFHPRVLKQLRERSPLPEPKVIDARKAMFQRIMKSDQLRREYEQFSAECRSEFAQYQIAEAVKPWREREEKLCEVVRELLARKIPCADCGKPATQQLTFSGKIVCDLHGTTQPGFRSELQDAPLIRRAQALLEGAR